MVFTLLTAFSLAIHLLSTFFLLNLFILGRGRTSHSHLYSICFLKGFVVLWRKRMSSAAIEPNCRLLCLFSCAPWATSPVLGMQVLDLEAPGNPIMEPHLKAGQLPQSSIALIHFHYWHLSIWDRDSKAMGRIFENGRKDQVNMNLGRFFSQCLFALLPYPQTDFLILLFIYFLLSVLIILSFLIVASDLN